MGHLEKTISQGLIRWYALKNQADVLYIGSENDAYADYLREIDIYCDIMTGNQIMYMSINKKYDYVICVEEFEKQKNIEEFFSFVYKMMKNDGILLIGANNRFGLRYFCGDRDPYTRRNFDSIENYCRAYMKPEDEFRGRAYSRVELIRILRKSGFEKINCYSVLSDLHNPSVIYAQDDVPNEDLSNRIFPTYNCPSTVFMEELNCYRGIVENGMFHQMANAYFLECTTEGQLAGVRQVTCSMERGEKDALYTIVHKSGYVEKKAAYDAGKKRLVQLNFNASQLKTRGVRVIDGKLEGESYVMPYESAESGQLYLKRLLHTDINQFLQKMDHFRDLILQSSEIVKEDCGDGNGAILRYGYMDLVPLNSFYKDGTFVFFDQEFREEYYPANELIWRMVATFYAGDIEAYAIYPMDKLLERYDLQKKMSTWQEMEWDFLKTLRSEDELREYHKTVRADLDEISSNRQRMNYSAKEYQRLFVDIFYRADTRKLFLFGSGNYTKKFLQIYAKDYPVYAILDNNAERWGQKLDGIEIQSPEIIKNLNSAEYKVIICIKNYLSVMKQLDEMGVGDYSIYDWNQDYPRKRKDIVKVISKENAPKKYHIGYVAGAFDMFHIGHLNLLRNAKEKCDYLIVGVLADETIREKKKKLPIIPQEDRVEIVGACKYVDQAEILPVYFNGIMDAYRMFHFDVQFSGDDHLEDDAWRKEKAELERVGADIIYFDYTEKISSTSLRNLLKEQQ